MAKKATSKKSTSKSTKSGTSKAKSKAKAAQEETPEVEETTEETTEEESAQEAGSADASADASATEPAAPPAPPRLTFQGETLEKFISTDYVSLAWVQAQLTRALRAGNLSTDSMIIVWANAHRDNYHVLLTTAQGQVIVPFVNLAQVIPSTVANIWGSINGANTPPPPALVDNVRELGMRCEETIGLVMELTQNGTNHITKSPPHANVVPQPQTPPAPAPLPPAQDGEAAQAERPQGTGAIQMPPKASYKERMRQLHQFNKSDAEKNRMPDKKAITGHFQQLMAQSVANAKATAAARAKKGAGDGTQGGEAPA